MKKSSTERFLIGRTPSGFKSPIEHIYYWGKRRTVVTESGERVTLSKRKLKAIMDKELTKKYG